MNLVSAVFQKWVRCALGCLALFASVIASGSETLDALYASRVIVPVVVNRAVYPVYGEYIEKQLTKYIKNQSRFELSPKGVKLTKSELKKYNILRVSEKKPETTKPGDKKASKSKREEINLKKIDPVLTVLGEAGIDTLLISEIRPEEDYRIYFHLVNVATRERLHTARQKVANRYTLESFSKATETALEKLFKELPFDATVVRRDGYRVVIDRGAPLSVGAEVPTYTVEYGKGELVLVETGRIQITHVEKRISFGQIVVEKAPREISQLNKIRIPSLHNTPTAAVGEEDAEREPATVSLGSSRTFGFVNLDFGAHLLSINNRTASGTGGASGTLMYPGGNFAAQFWVTRDMFFELGALMAINTAGSSGNAAPNASLNSNVNGFHVHIGYKVALEDSGPSPSLRIKVGYARRQFRIDPSTATDAFVTTTYSGVLFGAGFSIPASQRWFLNFDLHTYPFSSTKEEPLTSGAETTANKNFELMLGSTWEMSEKLDFHVKLKMIYNAADYTGAGTRPTTYVSNTQLTRAAFLGFSYYF